jgi:hypothetical protein
MRWLAALAVVAVLMSPAAATGQDYTLGDWARDQGYLPGDTMPGWVDAQKSSPSIEGLSGVSEFNWTAAPTVELWLQYNQISGIKSGDFSGLTNLTTLFLHRNQILSIESGAFSGLPHLRTVRLDHNRLPSIESGTFSELTNLTELFLYRNDISIIESGAFSGLPHLTVLELDVNDISIIESGAFSGLPHLTRLWLHDNMVLTELNLQAADFSSLARFNVRHDENITSVSLRNTVVNQTSLSALLGGGTNQWGTQYTGIGELDAVITEMDLSGIDFVDITDLEPLYVMDELTDLWFVDTKNVDASDLDLLLDNLETIEGTDSEGVLHMTLLNYIDFIVAGDGLLAAWDAEPGHHVEFLAIGDVNHDTEVNGLDVDPFVDVLLASRFDVAADMNLDGVVNGLDVDPFVAAVVGGTQSVPEPSTLLLALVTLGVFGGFQLKRQA